MANYTLTYNPDNQGWPSFYSYFPDYIIGMNSYLYTFDGGNLYRHNTSPFRNVYYGTLTPSSVTSVINSNPLEIKLFKTMSYESNTTAADSAQAAWEVTALSTDLSQGSMLRTYFVQKEGEWFSYIRNNSDTLNFRLRSAHGIGACTVVTGALTNACVIEFSRPPGYIISVGDAVYKTNNTQPPAISSDPTLIGNVTAVNNAVIPYSITIDNLNATAPPVFPAPVATDLILYYKNPVAESLGARGYFMEYTLTNPSSSPVEIFSVSGSVMKSFP